MDIKQLILRASLAAASVIGAVDSQPAQAWDGCAYTCYYPGAYCQSPPTTNHCISWWNGFFQNCVTTPSLWCWL